MKGRDVVLGILNNSPRTGYEINDILKNQLSYFYDGTLGMIYPTLRKLETEGKVKKEQISQDDKPNKKVYSITSKGKEEFKKYAKILYSEAKMIAGLPIDNPTEISNLICEVISK